MLINVKEWLDRDEYKGCLAAVGRHGQSEPSNEQGRWDKWFSV
jgi:hypothetical protein